MLLFHLLLLALTGVLLWMLRPHRLRHVGWLAALPPLVVTVWLLGQMNTIAAGRFPAEQYVWSPQLGLDLLLRLDGLALFFGLIITGIGAAIALYTGYYFAGNPRLGYFYGLLFLFMASMLGLVWADNLLLLFVFWEGTSLTSYLLIAFKLEDSKALEGARRALITTGLGALAMLGGMVLLAQMAGTYTLSAILTQPASQFTDHALYPAALLLILLGAFTKSAQFPFHFWLPGAMAAPTPASAYLHSATMVKAGIYLLARLHPALSDSPLWFWSLLSVGGITMLLGAITALRHYDLKAILAYATVSQLGVLVFLLALPSEKALIAVVVGILAHALYKGPLFLVAGILDHATGTRDIRQLAGLARAVPWVTATAILAGVSMAGFPPFFGFLAKEMLLESFYQFAEKGNPIVGWLGVAAVVVSGAFFVAYSLTLLWEPFFRRQVPTNDPGNDAAPVHHPPEFVLVLPALALVVLGTALPLLISLVEKPLLIPAVSAMAGTKVEFHLALWHGFTPMLLASLFAIALGIALFWARATLRAGLERSPSWLDGRLIFDQIVDALYGLARWITQRIQGGSLATHISVTLLCAVALLLYALLQLDWRNDLRINWAALPTFTEVILAVLGIVAAVVTVRTRSRLSAIISIGVVGVVVTLFFVFFSAPDLALTQLLIEVLTVVFLVLVFYRIPPRSHPPTPSATRWRNLAVASAVGVWGFFMVLLSVEGPFLPSIADFFLLNSVDAAHGGNIVNVIIVDFRGFDTLGEITVLIIAALGGYGLLRATRLRPVLVPAQSPDSDENATAALAAKEPAHA